MTHSSSHEWRYHHNNVEGFTAKMREAHVSGPQRNYFVFWEEKTISLLLHPSQIPPGEELIRIHTITCEGPHEMNEETEYAPVEVLVQLLRNAGYTVEPPK